MGTSKSITGTLAAILFATVAFGGPALAAPGTSGAPAVLTGDATSIPVGHLEFCAARPAECGPHAAVVATVELDQTRWTELLAVNADMNGSIVPVTDQDLYQVAEFWTYPNGYGDCEDIALAKRRALIAAGWPASTLLMAVVREANGDGHAVLMVRTDRGDLVLDNKDGRVNLWSDTPYQFLKRQSQADAGTWVDLVDDRPTILAAAMR